MKISAVIPCHCSHLKLLEEAVTSVKDANEIVISIDGTDKSEVIDKLQEKFNVIPIWNPDRIGTANGRNKATEVATGDIIVCQDADDVAHEQRIDLVREFFYTYPNAMVLNHGYDEYENRVPSKLTIPLQVTDPDYLYKWFFPNSKLEECVNIKKVYGFRNTHAGAVVFRKEVHKKVRYKPYAQQAFKVAEDYEFCMEALFHFKASYIIDLPLIHYRTGFNTGGDNRTW